MSSFLGEELVYYYVGDNSPLWCCKNAMDTKMECCYCLCNECYLNKEEEPPKKRNCKENANDCNHLSLEVEQRSSYFQAYYLRNCQVEKKYTPSRCSGCLKMLTGTKTMAMV